MGKGPISKIIIPIVGMTQEAIAHHKETKAAAAAAAAQPAHETGKEHHSRDIRNDDGYHHEYDELDSDGATEEVWAMDDAHRKEQQEKAPPQQDEGRADVNKMLESFAARHPIPSNPEHAQMNNPVIIPQRRPGTRERGFIRCYAPVLETCGIHQEEFLEFLDGFTHVIRYSNAFNAVNAAYGIAMITATYAAGIPAAAIAGNLVFHVSVEASRRGYVRYETNRYLDGMNEHLFRPHGLYAMLMTYKPDSRDPFQTIQHNSQRQAQGPQPGYEGAHLESTQALNAAILKRLDGTGSKLGGTSGTTHGELELPDAAPLIFPDVSELPPDQKQGAVKRAFKFLGDYQDAQAQAKFAQQNPDSRLANVGTSHQFASQFSDPNSAVSRHGLLALASGTRAEELTKKERAQMRRAMRAQRYGYSTQPNPFTPLGAVKTVLKSIKPNVIYLMILNMPGDEQMEAARNILAEEKANLHQTGAY